VEAPIDELYFTWLYGLVLDPRIKKTYRTYWRLFKLMYTKEFVWIVPNDDNRIEDGKDLRYEFVDHQKLMDVDIGWLNLGCSMLELLIGLSRRLSFETEGEPRLWFFKLLENADLTKFNDGYHFTDDMVNDRLDAIIWRTYGPTGEGGLFPLRNPCDNQRYVELWYQMSAYILENA
jgi:hypothetical protein